MTELEKKLQQNQNLYELYCRIKENTGEIWKEPVLPEFTNHGIQHSVDVIKIMDNILNFCGELELNAIETFILLSAAYLHDIGMQSMVHANGKADVLRENHAEYSYIVILNDGFPETQNPMNLKRLKCGFRDCNNSIDNILPLFVALVCKGHSEKYFQEVINEFVAYPSTIMEKKVDGAFLTALLMITDELHLSGREKVLDYQYYTPLSRLHQKKHQRIKDVSLSYNSGNHEIEVTIQFWFRSDDQDDLKEMLVNWIIEKLKLKFLLTKNILRRRMGMSLSHNIKKQFAIPSPPQYALPAPFDKEEIKYLEHEIAKSKIYDREEEKEHLSKILKGDFTGGIHLFYNVNLYDRDKLFDWFVNAASIEPGILFRLLILGEDENIAIDLNEIFTKTVAILSEDVIQCGMQSEFNKTLTETFSKTIERDTQLPRKLLMIEDIGLLRPELQRDYINLLVSYFNESKSNAIIIILSSS
ncbi:MAG: HD domain-containing protein, partial [bacterium]